MNYLEMLKQAAEKNNSIVCIGLDPVLEEIPVKEGDAERIITKFFADILSAIINDETRPAIVKPNYAFYAQYGFPGLKALKNVIYMYKEAGFVVLLDAKRGDIGKTSDAYARESFDFWGADAVTVAPYMGSDSVGPFIEWCKRGKGVYVLDRTSNPGAVDLQNLKVNSSMPVYMCTASNIIEWHKPGVGAVVGATYPKELEEISELFVRSGKQIPLLIPGVGKQGGSAAEVIETLKRTDNPTWLHRINSSSGIIYAYKSQDTDDYAGAAVKAIKQLNAEIGKI